jgi:hypothetical protein
MVPPPTNINPLRAAFASAAALKSSPKPPSLLDHDKGTMIARDLDLLHLLMPVEHVSMYMSLITLDRDLWRRAG